MSDPMIELKEKERLLLYKIYKLDTDYNTSELARHMKFAPNTLNKYLFKLQGLGFVSSKPEKPAIKWSLTEKGRIYIEEYLESEVGQAQLTLWKNEKKI
jgi:Mn-dependent DtxR family transcriptional regulator